MLLCTMLVPVVTAIANKRGDKRAIASTLLVQHPMIMAHDAGSGYLGSGLIDAWTKTQDGGLAEQLACGARAFDARPHYSAKDGLQWHHGDIVVPHPFAASLDEMIAWLAIHPTELSTLHLWDCAGDGCPRALSATLASRNITVVTNCSILAGLTYGEAKALGTLPGGGSILALTVDNGCSESNYDPSITCTGHRASAVGADEVATSPQWYGCWLTDASREIPIRRMFAYLDHVAALGPREDRFMQAQALWQESVDSVLIGTLRNSSLLSDEARSELNHNVADAILHSRWASVSLLEVNNVCDGGPALFEALQRMASEAV